MTSCAPVKLSFSCVEPEGGTNDKPPIIFCHGLVASKTQWEESGILKIVADATKRKVYAIDSRNMGYSEWADVMDSDANVEDLLHFMDTIGVKTVTIVGHSMGGSTAMRAALKAPERVASIVVEDMFCSELPKIFFDLTEAFSTHGPEVLEQLPAGASVDEAMSMICNRVFNLLPDAKDKVVYEEDKRDNTHRFKRLENGRLAFRCNVKAIKNAVKEPGCHSLIPGYEGVYEGPACFIYGTLSPINVKGDEENIKKHFPKAELIPIENANHDIHVSRKDEFLEAVLEFLSK